MQNLEYNKNFPKIPQDLMHTKPRLQALNNFNFGSTDQRYKKEFKDRIFIKDLRSYKLKYWTKEAGLI